jgi:glucan phosphoethanolaminetransferase (alkaline phosphatase superfamily)
MISEQLSNSELVLKTAKKRVAFKKHITIYILVNLFLWVLFLFLFKWKSIDEVTFLRIILFILFIWAIALAGHYFFAVKWNKKMLEKEIISLMKDNNKHEEII